MMVALRVVIGWHFFQEGLNHKHDPKWSSEGFLRAAKGPLADFYQSKAPGLHNYHVLLAVPLDREADGKPAGLGENQQPEKADESEKSLVYSDWYGAIVKDWQNRSTEIANRYAFTDEQRKKLDELLGDYDKQLVVVFKGNKEQAGYADDMRAYRHQLHRNRKLGAAAGAEDIPNLASRMKKREANPTSEQATQIDSTPAQWLADVKGLETAFEQDALALRSEEQTKIGPLPEALSDLRKMDTAITWLLIVGGGCLVVGLFTRLSAFALALFLASVVFSQPFWVADAVKTTYFEWTELVALLVLATSPVGRWAGLDFFIHHVLLRPFRSG
jgi:uncharacterized membrane protein YphA (DoxX/SURF4 family)